MDKRKGKKIKNLSNNVQSSCGGSGRGLYLLKSIVRLNHCILECLECSELFDL